MRTGGPRAVLGDDDGGLRAAVVAAILAGGATLVGETSSGRELIALCAVHQPEVVVVDLAISGELGTTLVPRLLAAAPQATVFVFDLLTITDTTDHVRVRVVPVDDLRELRDAVAVSVQETIVLPEVAGAAVDDTVRTNPPSS